MSWYVRTNTLFVLVVRGSSVARGPILSCIIVYINLCDCVVSVIVK